MSLEYIQDRYSVPARLGQRIRFTGSSEPQEGIITGAEGAYIAVKFPTRQHSVPLHPTSNVEYLQDDTQQAALPF